MLGHPASFHRLESSLSHSDLHRSHSAWICHCQHLFHPCDDVSFFAAVVMCPMVVL